MWMTSLFIFSKGHSESCEALGKYLWTDSNKDLSLAAAYGVSSRTGVAAVTGGEGCFEDPIVSRRDLRVRSSEVEGLYCSGLPGQGDLLSLLVLGPSGPNAGRRGCPQTAGGCAGVEPRLSGLFRRVCGLLISEALCWPPRVCLLPSLGLKP